MEYKCNFCNKNYASYQSRCNHIRKYHKNDSSDVNVKVNVSVNEVSMFENEEDMKYICIKCNKKFKFRQGKWAHEKICQKEKNLEIEIIKKDFEEYKKESQKEMERLKDMIQKSMKIHPKTLQKINNQLNNTNTLTNNYYVQLGNEDLLNVLSKSEKKAILNRKAMGINDLVELIHCSGRNL